MWLFPYVYGGDRFCFFLLSINKLTGKKKYCLCVRFPIHKVCIIIVFELLLWNFSRYGMCFFLYSIGICLFVYFCISCVNMVGVKCSNIICTLTPSEDSPPKEIRVSSPSCYFFFSLISLVSLVFTIPVLFIGFVILRNVFFFSFFCSLLYRCILFFMFCVQNNEVQNK